MVKQINCSFCLKKHKPPGGIKCHLAIRKDSANLTVKAMASVDQGLADMGILIFEDFDMGIWGGGRGGYLSGKYGISSCLLRPVTN